MALNRHASLIGKCLLCAEVRTRHGNIPFDSRWPKMRQPGLDDAEVVRAASGTVDVVNLPEADIKGNSHMMMDKNNAQAADLIQKWLTGKALAD